MYSYKENKVSYEGKEIYSFSGPIQEMVAYKDKCIVLYRLSDEFYNSTSISVEEKYNNIMSLDKSGAIIWRIEGDSPGPGLKGLYEYKSLKDFNKDPCDEFPEGYWTHSGGIMNRFDPETGKIVERVFTK